MIAPKSYKITRSKGAIMKEDINNIQFSKLLIFFKSKKNIYIKSEESLRLFLAAVCDIMYGGFQWRRLSTKYGKSNTIYKRFNDWSKKRIWSELLEFCIQNPDMENIMIDSTIVRAHACAAGLGDQKMQGLGRTAGGFTTRIHAAVDGLGNLLKFIVTSGQIHDLTQAPLLLGDISNANVICDRAYNSEKFRNQIITQDCTPVIPSKSNSKNPAKYDKHIYKERHLIENFIGKIKHFRRIFSRFDKSIINYSSFISFAGALLWLR
jgi:transposase